MPTDYIDDYPTCFVTYADLRIYHDDLDPDRITGLLGIEPSWAVVKGRVYTRPSGREITPSIGGWRLSTEGVIASRDVRRHVDWILDRLAGKDETLVKLRSEGYVISVFCLWQSVHGHGGPMLSPEIMRRLGKMELEIGFDIFHPCDD